MRFTRLINIFFHPILIPLYSVFILFHSGSWMSTLNREAKIYVYLVTLSTTIVLPLVSLYVLKTWKWISDYQVSVQQERRIPLMLYSLFALVGAFILQKVSAPLTLALIFNGISIVLLLCALISYKWNISIYMVFMGVLVGLILAIGLQWMLDIRLWLMVAFVASALVAFVRLRDQRHHPAQVYAGFGLGFISLFLLIFLI